MNTMEKCRQNTENFLRSYHIQKAMSEVSGYDETQGPKISANVPSTPIRPFNEDLQCGQIRLLADVDRITYIVLLRRWNDNAFMTMAFSHYDYPATDEEMSLERDVGLYLNVLQAWNTRSLMDETLKKSWLCGTLSEEQCSDAWTFWLALTTGSELPERLREKSGIPIEDENDIRLDYLQEEMAVFSAVDSADLTLAETSSAEKSPETEAESSSSLDWMNGLILFPLWNRNEPMPLAAGGEKKAIRKKCVIDGRKEILHLAFSSEEGTAWIDIFSADDSDFSVALDGSKIVDADECELGTILDGSCMLTVGKDFDGRIAIRLKDGTICTLEEKP